jgi:hypothetical protein
MKEAVVTVVVPATSREPAYTIVLRVQFEGAVAYNDTDGVVFGGVVSTERLVAKA